MTSAGQPTREEVAPAPVAAASCSPDDRSDPVDFCIASSRNLCTPNCIAVIGAIEPALTCIAFTLEVLQIGMRDKLQKARLVKDVLSVPSAFSEIK